MPRQPPKSVDLLPTRGQLRVLVVDDDPAIRMLCRSLLEPRGFLVEEADTGQEALSLLLGRRPDLLIVDQQMPGMQGSELVQILREHPAFQTLPIAMLTAQSEVADRVRGLDAGADDYISKPVAPAELDARIRALLRRSERDLSTDLLTRLPGNVATREEVSRRLASGQVFQLAYADLDHFKPYVDHYGFESAAVAITRSAETLSQAVLKWGESGDFLGHLGGDDFLMLLAPDSAAGVCQASLDSFSAMAPSLYGAQDRERGHLEGLDRYGTPRRFPLLGISIASLRVEPGDFADRAALGSFAAHCKDEVKRSGGNRWARFSAP